MASIPDTGLTTSNAADPTHENGSGARSLPHGADRRQDLISLAFAVALAIAMVVCMVLMVVDYLR